MRAGWWGPAGTAYPVLGVAGAAVAGVGAAGVSAAAGVAGAAAAGVGAEGAGVWTTLAAGSIGLACGDLLEHKFLDSLLLMLIFVFVYLFKARSKVAAASLLRARAGVGNSPRCCWACRLASASRAAFEAASSCHMNEGGKSFPKVIVGGWR